MVKEIRSSKKYKHLEELTNFDYLCSIDNNERE